jgi:hypothetical protein
MDKKKYIMGLDVSTSTIGVAVFENLGNEGKLILLKHVKLIVKPKPENKLEELFRKVEIFENQFLVKFVDLDFEKIIIEEPLLRSNNINTVGLLLRFNSLISKSCYDYTGVIPDFISSYDSRKYAFPELMGKRIYDSNGNKKKNIDKIKPTLFGAYDKNVDKKKIIWEKVNEKENDIQWIYNKKGELKKENFDMSDAYTCCLGYMKKNGFWN